MPDRRTVYLATGNAHKVAEFRALAAATGCAWQLEGAAPLGGMPEVEETATDFAGNARIKAAALRALAPAGTWVMADDSGLAVVALGGRPGVKSARFAGPGATDAANRARLLEELRQHAAATGERAPWLAYFACALCLLGPDGEEVSVEGRCAGAIVDAPRGSGGFGYDVLFVPEGHGQTFGELAGEVKDRLSHRGHAWRALLAACGGGA